MGNTLRDIDRTLKLFWVLIRYGWKPFIYGIVLRKGLSRYGGHFRLALEEMGLTYVKLGQFLAMRFDILEPEVIRELSLLFEKARPVPEAAIEKQILEGLGKPISECFAKFNLKPIASASVAQVQVAYTFAGRRLR